jgi:transposase-like protein
VGWSAATLKEVAMEPQSRTVEELRRGFEQAREVAPAAGVRAAALAYYRARAEQGATQAEVARELGVHPRTLAKWHQRPSGAPQRGAGREGQQPASAASTEAGDALKREVEGLGPRSPSRRFPPELKARLVEWARGELERGRGASEVADALGVPWESLSAWLGRRPGRRVAGTQVRAVRVVPSRVSLAPAGTRGPLLRSPAGYLVEGLDVDGLAQLLRRLG